MLQQQPIQLAQDCPSCPKRQQMIDKFTQLVHLLKIKGQKYDQSKLKSSLPSQFNWLHSNKSQNLSAMKFLIALEKCSFKSLFSSFKIIQNQCSNHCFPFIAQSGIIKQVKYGEQTFALQGSSLQVKKAIPSQNSSKQTKKQRFMGNQMVYFDGLKINTSPKLLLKHIFELTHENEALSLKLRNLQTNMQQNMRRQERDIAKKRQSLLGLSEQLSEKNEVIEDLKYTIKSLQSKLSARDNILLHQLLEEDGQTLRRAILKLQNTNQQLNNQVAKVRSEKEHLQRQNKKLAQSIETLKGQIRAFKESFFEVQCQANQNELQKRELEIVSQKISHKLQKAKRTQKKFNELIRAKDSISTHSEQITIFKSERKVETTLNSLQNNHEERANQLQIKLQSVFTFLFNLQKQNYELNSAELFDDEQKELLLTHKKKFIATLRAQDFTPIKKASKRCLQQKMDMLGDSFLNAFQEHPAVSHSHPKQNHTQHNVKLMQLEIERNKLIGKIAEVKEKELHMRCVILQLLKSLELRNVNKDTESIVTLLCDIFEYSEEQRNMMVQTKSKKFFGLL